MQNLGGDGMVSADARLAWLCDFIETWIVRAEAEKRAMSFLATERLRLDGELVVLRVLRGMIVTGVEEVT